MTHYITHPSILGVTAPLRWPSNAYILYVGSSITSATGRYYETRRIAGMRASISAELHERVL